MITRNPSLTFAAFGDTGQEALLLAEELGLAMAERGSDGWTDTAVPDTTAAAYRAEFRRLGDALVACRRAPLCPVSTFLVSDLDRL